MSLQNPITKLLTKWQKKLIDMDNNTTNKNLKKLLKKNAIEKEVKKTHEENTRRVKREIEKLRKEVNDEERKNLERFKKLPKGTLLQFGEFQIYVRP